MADRFPSPFEIETPEGAEGWQEMYVYSSLFSEARRDFDDNMFWFQDGVHWPKVLTPWDATFFEFGIASLSQYNTRHLQVPPANGIALGRLGPVDTSGQHGHHRQQGNNPAHHENVLQPR